MALAISGPRSAQLLRDAFGDEVLSGLDRILSVKTASFGLAPGIIARISLSGELGYELYVEGQYFLSLYKHLLEVGKTHGLVKYGAWALLSLRLEKGYGIWSREFAKDYTPFESGLSQFIDFEKPEFIGRDALLSMRQTPPKRQLVSLAVDAHDVDSSGFEPVWIGDQLVGYTTSGGYGHATKLSIAMAYIDSAQIAPETVYEIHILGERRKAKLIDGAAYDPQGIRPRQLV